MPLLILLLLFVGVALFWLARRGRAATGLPPGRVASSDTGAGNRLEIPLYSSDHGLTGRPDYLIEDRGGFIPVEIKSSAAPASGPFDSHVYQLAAYCLLVEQSYGVRPTHGLIRYRDKTYAVDYTPGLEADLLALLNEMRESFGAKAVDRSHDTRQRCRGCGYRGACDQSLA